jgi:hypothetical protein
MPRSEAITAQTAIHSGCWVGAEYAVSDGARPSRSSRPQTRWKYVS